MRGFGLGLYGKVRGNAVVGTLLFYLGDDHLSLLLVIWLLCWSDALALYWEVLWIKDAFFSLEMGLKGSQPWISQYETLSPDVGDQEPHLSLFLVSGYTEIDVSGDIPCFVLCVINIEQLLWFVQQGCPQL